MAGTGKTALLEYAANGAEAGTNNDRIERIVMATALVEDSRITLYRQRLAALLRRRSSPGHRRCP